MPDTTVMVGDGQPVIRNGLRALLADTPGMRLVAEAATARDAVREALLHRPDVLIVDPQLAEPGGAAVIGEIHRSAPGVGVLVFTMADDDASVLAAIRAGARGYLGKGATAADIVRAVHGVAAGAAVLGPSVAARLPALLATATATATGSAEPFPELTARERDVLHLVAAGLANGVIARRLQLAPKTVANHLSAILAKLRVASRPEAIVRARDAGLGAH